MNEVKAVSAVVSPPLTYEELMIGPWSPFDEFIASEDGTMFPGADPRFPMVGLVSRILVGLVSRIFEKT